MAALLASAPESTPKQQPLPETASPQGQQSTPDAAPVTVPSITLPVLPVAPASTGAADGIPTPPPAESPSVPVPLTADSPDDDGGIIVTARRRPIAADPLVGINAASFEAIQAVDKLVVAPIAGAYEKTVPTPVRNGLRNVLINLAEPIVFINYLLQFKPGKAAETVGRFALNSTIGVAGLFDMAKRKPFHLPYRPNGFANTFGYHGVKNGPFLFVPILGPTTLRDLVGRVLDLGLIPAVVGRPFDHPAYGMGTGIVKSMNDRVEFDEQITAMRATDDPYAVTRNFYLKRRQAEIDALHSPAYRLRKGIADPVLRPIQPHVSHGTAPGTEADTATTSIPSSTGMAPAAPALAAPASDTPSLVPAQ